MLDMLDKILELLENKDFPQLGNLLKDMNPQTWQSFLKTCRVKRWRLCFACSQKEFAADAFAYMNPTNRRCLLKHSVIKSCTTS